MIGIVKGREIKPNKDGTVDRILLQVEFTENDVRTIELMPGNGVDFNPVTGSRVFVASDSDSYQLAIASTDDIEPESNTGEYEIYSNDSGTKKAKIKLKTDEEIVINDGTDYAVAFNELKTAFDQLKSDFDNFVNTIFNLHNHPTAPTGPVSVPSVTGSSSTADIDPAKVDKVRLP